MLNITKYKILNDCDVFCINTDQGTFEIYLSGNLDLYWRYKDIGSSKDIPEFIITKEDCFVYDIFYALFNSVKNNQPYWNMPYNSVFKNKKIDNIDINNPYSLFKNNRIEWHSDDLPYDRANSLIIEELDDAFRIAFKRGLGYLPNQILIRFSNNGSRYAPFNTTFMNMYKMLGNYNFDNHQIYLEEYTYKLKRYSVGNHE